MTSELYEKLNVYADAFQHIREFLNEKERRLFLAETAIQFGYGAGTVLSERTGVSYSTIRRGVKELLTGETAEEALAREIREELDTEIAVDAPFDRVEYDYPEFHLSMQCFLCRVIRGSLVLKEHEAARWLRMEDIYSVDWLPADRVVVDNLKWKS